MNMRKFYLLFRDKKVNALRSQLSWSHYREVLSLKDINEIIYYLNECENKDLSFNYIDVNKYIIFNFYCRNLYRSW